MSLSTFDRQYQMAGRLIGAKGARVTFAWTTTTRDPTTGLSSAPVPVSAVGVAVQVRGKPLTYQKLGLIESEAPTLLFRPDTRGGLPSLTATVVFGGETFTVVDVDQLDPDGEGAIMARVVVQR